MKKRAFPTAIVVLIFVLLLIYANKYEVEEKLEPGKDRPVQMARVTAADVRAAVWKTPGQPDVRVENRPEGGTSKFRLTAPRALSADEEEINGVLRSFEDLKSEFTIVAAATDTAPFGIGSASPRLTLETATGPLTFTLGDPSPVGGSVYFQKEGDPAVYLVPSFVAAAFRKAENDLRSKLIFEESFDDIGSVTVFLGTESVTLVRGKGIDWSITAPRALPADAIEASGLVTGVRTLKVSRFVSETTPEKDEYGFGKPTFRVTLQGASGSFELVAGRSEGSEVYVKRSDRPAVFAVTGTALDLLRKGLNKLRTKELPRLDENALTGIILQSGTGTFRLEPASGSWRCGEQKLEPGRVKSLAQAYLANHVKTFLPWDACDAQGLKDLAGCPWMELQTASVSRKVYFGKGNGTEIAIVLDGEKEVFLVPIQTYDAYKSLLDQVTPKPVPVPATPVTGSDPVSVAPKGAVTPGPVPAVSPDPATAAAPAPVPAAVPSTSATSTSSATPPAASLPASGSGSTTGPGSLTVPAAPAAGMATPSGSPN